MTQETAIIGSVRIVISNSSITIQDRDNESVEISIGKAQLPQLVSFLGSHQREADGRRLGFRVPITGDDALSARVTCRGTEHVATGINLSLSGILVSSSSLSQSVRVDDEAEVVLERKGDCVSLHGTIRRLEGEQAGIEFAGVRTGQDLEPPADLLPIFRSLETEWLRQRVGAA